VLVYVLRRLLLAIAVFVAVSFIGFLVLSAPLDPTWRQFGPIQSPAREALRHKHDLDDPVVERYWLWAKGTVTGTPDVSHAVFTGEHVWSQVWPALGRTALLIGLSLVGVTILSLAIGTVGATRPGSVIDVTSRTGAYLAWSIPAFLLAVLLQLLLTRLAVNYDWHPLPVSGIPIPGEAGSGLHFIVIWLQHLALPVFVIAVGLIGAYSRYVRTAMLVSLNEPYAVTARAKGLTERRVVVRHALRNSLIPFVSLLTLDFGAVFGASLIADLVFQQQGIATFMALAVRDADPFEVQPLVLVAGASVLVFSVLGDLLSTWLDPRIRLG
jgi:peptide/nickel transport system permease protein